MPCCRLSHRLGEQDHLVDAIHGHLGPRGDDADDAAQHGADEGSRPQLKPEILGRGPQDALRVASRNRSRSSAKPIGPSTMSRKRLASLLTSSRFPNRIITMPTVSPATMTGAAR